MPNSSPERQLPTEHKLWVSNFLTLSRGHHIESGELVLHEPAWWAVCVESPAVYAIKACTATQSVEALEKELDRKVPHPELVNAELYPDIRWKYIRTVIKWKYGEYLPYEGETESEKGLEAYWLDVMDQQVDGYEVLETEMVQEGLELVAAGRGLVRMIGMSLKAYE